MDETVNFFYRWALELRTVLQLPKDQGAAGSSEKQSGTTRKGPLPSPPYGNQDWSSAPHQAHRQKGQKLALPGKERQVPESSRSTIHFIYMCTYVYRRLYSAGPAAPVAMGLGVWGRVPLFWSGLLGVQLL